MLRVVAIDSDPEQRLSRDLILAGHQVRVATSWVAAAEIEDGSMQAVVIAINDPERVEVLAQLTLLRAQWTVPIVVLVADERWTALARLTLGRGLIPCAHSALTSVLGALAPLPSSRDATPAGGCPIVPMEDGSIQHPASASLRAAQSTAILTGLPQPLVEDLPLASGAILDRYRIDGLIGRGTFAHVYRASQLATGRPMAIKVLRRHLAANPQVVQRFLDEARLAARCEHPHVVRILDLAHDPSATYLVMEWIEGLTLGEVITASGQLPIPQALRIAAAVAGALVAIHAADVVHRDVKPANILLGNDGAIRLVDFGLACTVRGMPAQAGEGRVVGTPHYMAPEQAFRPGLVDDRSDLYALGATLWHAITGTPPFPGLDTIQVLAEHRSQKLPDLEALAPDLPAGVISLLTRLLAKDPDDRPAGAQAVALEAELLLADSLEVGKAESNGWSTFYTRRELNADRQRS